MKQFHARPELRSAVATGNTADFAESVASVELSEQQQAQIKEIFDLFDTDGGGSIDCREKDAALYALGFQPTFDTKLPLPDERPQDGAAASKDSCSDTVKEDTNQTITLHEFTQMMKGEQVVRNPLDAIWGAFAELSSGADQNLANTEAGLVTLEGLRRACDKYDVKLNNDELNLIISDCDTDGDGAVDKSEFLRVMNQAPWF